jgi:hypothetical protein
MQRPSWTPSPQNHRSHTSNTLGITHLGQAATAGRFGHGDLAAILAHQAGDPDHDAGQPTRASEHNSLAQGTAGWARLGEQEVN